MTTYIKLQSKSDQVLTKHELYNLIISDQPYVVLSTTPAQFKRTYIELAKLAPELQCKSLSNRTFEVKLNKLEIK